MKGRQPQVPHPRREEIGGSPRRDPQRQEGEGHEWPQAQPRSARSDLQLAAKGLGAARALRSEAVFERVPMMGPEPDALAARPHALPPPDDEEVERLLQTVALSVVSLLRKQGKLDNVSCEGVLDALRAVLGRPSSDSHWERSPYRRSGGAPSWGGAACQHSGASTVAREILEHLRTSPASPAPSSGSCARPSPARAVRLSCPNLPDSLDRSLDSNDQPSAPWKLPAQLKSQLPN